MVREGGGICVWVVFYGDGVTGFGGKLEVRLRGLGRLGGGMKGRGDRNESEESLGRGWRGLLWGCLEGVVFCRGIGRVFTRRRAKGDRGW